MQRARRLKKLEKMARQTERQAPCNCDWHSDVEHSNSRAMQYLQLAQRTGNLEVSIALYTKAMEEAEREMPPNAFDKWSGNFWLVPDTRLFMMAKASLAQMLRLRGDFEEAASHLRDLLKLNPNDNQGNRWHLAPTLVDLSRERPEAFDELDELLARYPEPFANMVFTKALSMFRKHGNTEASRAALSAAIAKNMHVLKLLRGPYPNSGQVPDHFGLGSEEEAFGYVYETWHQWRDTPGWEEFLTTADAQQFATAR